MKLFRWAARTLIRAPLRGALLVGVLGVSIGLALIMITVNGAFAERVDEIQGEVGATVTVRPAGSLGGAFAFRIGGASGEEDDSQPTLTDDHTDQIADIENVTSYSRQVSEQYTGDALESSIELPEGFDPPEGAQFAGPPILVTGTDDASGLSNFAVDGPEVVGGRTWTEDETEANVVVMGDQLAEKNGLEVGDTFDLNGTEVEVIGIYSTGTEFGDNGMFMPLETARTLFDRGNEIDEIAVKAASSGDVRQVADDVRVALGEEVADVTTDEAIFDSIAAPINDAKDSSEIAMIAALVASAAVILFSVGIVARQRIKEIGILKAIGASNWHVVGQMTAETAMIAVVAAVIGAAATFPLAQTVADGLVSDPSTGAAAPGGFVGEVDVADGDEDGGPIRGAGPIRIGPGASAANDGGVFGDVEVAVSPEVFGYALAIGIGLAVLATIVPAWYVGRVRPAEVLRYE